MATLGDVKAKVRALVGDPMGDFTTDAYLTPLINIVYADQATQLMAETGSEFDEDVRDIPKVPAGTTDLSIYQALKMPTGGLGPLYGMVTPLILEVKPAGTPVEQYVEAVGPVRKLPNVSAGSAPPTWEYRRSTVYVTPLNYSADMRVRGEFTFTMLIKDTDMLTVHPFMGEATAYGAAALIGVERKNDTWMTTYGDRAGLVLGNIGNLLVRAEQGTTTRIGRGGSRRR